MSRSDLADERLVARVLGGDPVATRQFVDLAGSVILPAVKHLAGEGKESETAFIAVMKGLRENDFARLRRFNGSCPLPRFLALAARDVLAEDVAKAFSLDPNRAWRTFERFFGADIRRRIRARFPRAAEDQREDLYQEVILKLVEADCRRIKAFSGNGSFTGYILGVVENLLRDLLRREARRRRLPAAVQRLSPLHQGIFVAVVWRDIPPEAQRLAPALRTALEGEVDLAAITLALSELSPHIAKAREEVARNPPLASASDLKEGELENLADPAPGAEEKILSDAEEAHREALMALIRRKADALPKADRLYLQLFFYDAEPAKPREIAKTMSLPVEEVYRLRERTLRWLREVAKDFQLGTPS